MEEAIRRRFLLRLSRDPSAKELEKVQTTCSPMAVPEKSRPGRRVAAGRVISLWARVNGEEVLFNRCSFMVRSPDLAWERACLRGWHSLDGKSLAASGFQGRALGTSLG